MMKPRASRARQLLNMYDLDTGDQARDTITGVTGTIILMSEDLDPEPDIYLMVRHPDLPDGVEEFGPIHPRRLRRLA